MLSSRKVSLLVLVMVLFGAVSLRADEGRMSRSKGGFFTNLFQPTPPAPACELNVKEHYDFYDINGTSVGDLRKQMRSNGTKWNDGRVYAALTTWDIHYSYDIFDHEGKCGVKSVSTDVDIVYHFPRRIATLATPDEIGGIWNDYYEHLKVHEFGHKELAVKAAGEINETLASLTNFSSRTELEREVKRLIDAKLKKLNDDQIEYDAETHHGASQGAVLPQD